MTVAARQIDPEVWSQSRYLAWLEGQPENAHFEFDGARPVAIVPATVGHNRVGRNIRDAIRDKLPTGTLCDIFGPQDAIGTVGGALREPDALIACSQPPRNGVVVPAPVVILEVLSPGRENRRRDEQEKVDEYESVPTILRYVVVESERRATRSSGMSLATVSRVEARRKPACRSACPSSASNSRWTRSTSGSSSTKRVSSGGCLTASKHLAHDRCKDMVTLPPKLERFATEAIASGHGQDLSDVFAASVSVLRRAEAWERMAVASLAL